MTEEAKRVVAGLRYCYRHIHCYSIKDGERCPDYDSCQKKVADNVSRNDALADLIESLSAQLEQVTRERDALQVEIDVLNEEYYAGIHTIRPTVDAAPRWISVKERLPEIGDQVLVTDDFGCVGTGTCDTFGYRRHISVDGCSQFGCIPTVKYWMPLPEPPKEDT